MIDRLEELEANKDKLWLVETQSYGEFSDYYGYRILEDFTLDSPEDHQTIAYYHENGDVLEYATFNEADEASLKNAAKFLACYLN